METDPNPMPEFKLFKSVDKLCRLGHFLFDHIQSPGMSDHANRGGGPALDRALYDQPEYESAGSYYFKDQVEPVHPEGWGNLLEADD